MIANFRSCCLGLLLSVLGLDAATVGQEIAVIPDKPIPPPRQFYMGRRIAQTMHFTGAEWLIRNTREREERCTQMIQNLGVTPGMAVCDMGCGNGFYSLWMAKLVGPKGRVLAVDIQSEMLRLLQARAAEQDISNVEPVLGSVANPNLPAGEVDLILCVDVYHEFSHPELMLAAMRKSLSTNGVLVLVEYRAEDKTVPIKPLHKMSKAQVLKELVPNGFRLVREYDELPWQHMMFFGRDEQWKPGNARAKGGYEPRADATVKSALESSFPHFPRSLALVEVLLIFLLFFAVAGSAAPDVNEAHYLAKARHYWDPTWCPNDFFLDSADAHLVFYWTFGWVTQFLSLTAVAWVGRLLTWLLLAWSWRRLSVAVVPGPLVSLLTAGLYTGLLRWGHMAGEWIIGGVEAKSFSYVLVFLGLEAIARRRWRAVWPLLGAATCFHVLVGGWSFVAAVIAWVVAKEDRAAWKSLLPWIVGGACLALPGLVPALALTWGTDPSIVREANQIYVFERLRHHLVFHRLPVAHIVRFVVLLGCWRSLLGYARVQGASRRLNAFVMGGVLIGALGVLIDQAAVGLAVVGSWFGLYDLYLRPLVAALLRYYWFRLSDVMVPLGIALLTVEILRIIARSRPVAAEYLLAGTMVLVMLHVGEVVYSHRKDPRPPAVIQSMTKEGSTDDERAQAYLGWRPTCAWIANNTPTNSLFLTPRNQQTFKWDAQRGEVVARKDIPQDASGIVEWRRRTRELYPGQVEQFGLVAHGETDLIRFSQQYGFEYVVIDRTYSGRRLNLRRVFPLIGDSENPFEVYCMPGTGSR